MIRASDLIGAVVHTESGQKLGRVHDLRAHRSGDGWLLMGIVIGPKGLLVRFQGGAPDAAVRPGNVIPWEAITRLEDGGLVVRDELTATPGT